VYKIDCLLQKIKCNQLDQIAYYTIRHKISNLPWPFKKWKTWYKFEFRNYTI